jgi:hypothetical protein
MLNCIALLLVERCARDVAAVSYRRTNDTVDIMYAINKAAANTCSVVVDEVVAVVNAITDTEMLDMDHFHKQLAAIAPAYCKAKLERRREKLADVWKAAIEPPPVRLAVPMAQEVYSIRERSPLASLAMFTQAFA